MRQRLSWRRLARSAVGTSGRDPDGVGLVLAGGGRYPVSVGLVLLELVEGRCQLPEVVLFVELVKGRWRVSGMMFLANTLET